MMKFTAEQLFLLIDNIPMYISVLNEKGECVYCNEYAVKFYNMESKEDFYQKFYECMPEVQPDGKESKSAFDHHLALTLEKGENHFGWLDLKNTGEEIPLSVDLYKLNIRDDDGQELLACCTCDLRSQLAGGEEDAAFDEYYYNSITYKDLFTTVAELTEEWFWVYDVKMATIQFFGKGRNILGLVAEKQPFPSYVVDSGMVYPDDLDAFLSFDKNLKTGLVEPTEVRFILPSGEARYYRIIYKTMYDQDGNPRFSIGKTYDINQQKKLEVLSKTDLLTNCLNKVTTEYAVKHSIESAPESSHALFIIDVDDFKSVNDNLGHYFGDIALMDIAKNLRANFRGADIIGRIGGDEFLVFVKDVSNSQVITAKAEAIVNAFKNSYSGENNDYKISGSIGVAIYPKHAHTYDELYQCADKALYSSKMAGKDCYTIYSEKLADEGMKKLTEVDNTRRHVESHFDAELTYATCDLMCQTEDRKKTMNTVIRLLGTKMNVDRCYVAQTFDDGQTYSITYEWTSHAMQAIKSDFQNIDVEALKRVYSELEQNGIMYHNHIHHDTELAYLLVQAKGKGFTRVVLGIEDGNVNRVWSEKEIGTLQYIIKMVSIFLLAEKQEN